VARVARKLRVSSLGFDPTMTRRITTAVGQRFLLLQKNTLRKRFPDLEKLPEEYLIPYLEFMQDHGFQRSQAAEMVLLNPSLLRNHQKTIPRTLDAWRSLGCEMEDIANVLTQHPQLTDVSAIKLHSRFSFLGKYFSRFESLSAIEGSIQVLMDSKNVLEKKLIFLIEELSHRPSLIVDSSTLSFPINHIRSRHEFLIRAGIFIPVPYNKLHKKSYIIHPKLERPNYYSPHDIVCTNDTKFIQTCANGLLTINELAAFEEAYEKELEAENYFGDDDEDEDLEDEDTKDNPELEVFANNPGARVSNSSSFFNKKDSSDFYY